MQKRALIKKLIAGETVERCGFWLGMPDQQTWPILHRYFGTENEEELRLQLGDDCRWICPQFSAGVYQDPHGRALFDPLVKRENTSLGCAGPLANCETLAEVAAYPWPDVQYLHFDSCLNKLQNAGDVYRFSGMWTCFYHDLIGLFGMEEYMMKMYIDPDIVKAATDRVCEFYYAANEKFFAEAGDMVDGYFFGNDFGTQLSLICGPDQLDEFIMPWFRRFTAQGKEHGYQVILHSCGSIYNYIDRLIDAGIDCLHPLQAKAANMEAEHLAAQFKGRIAFMGGIDTQYLLSHGTPEEIMADVRRVKTALGPNLIVSPSHEAILPDVPPANVEAMAKAALEGGLSTTP
ncbi:MAG: uroporphyrinogen decarboxylase family protein [bacterium]